MFYIFCVELSLLDFLCIVFFGQSADLQNQLFLELFV